MKYLELSFSINPYNEAATDVLAALLADAGCDTFVPSDQGLTAYCLQDAYDETAIQGAIDATLAAFPATTDDDSASLAISFSCAEAPDENWNATWEAEHHFEPIALPDGQQIHIIPRQAFGSGEHATTRMILSLLADLPSPLAGTTVIDAGCGTGILGIAALKLGAAKVFAYDIDEWSVRNALENFELNGVSADVRLGDAAVLNDAPEADVLVANINRNILLADMPAFVDALKPEGLLILSGFYEADIAPLVERASTLQLQLLTTRADGDWRALLFNKVRA